MWAHCAPLAEIRLISTHTAYFPRLPIWISAEFPPATRAGRRPTTGWDCCGIASPDKCPVRAVDRTKNCYGRSFWR